MSMSEKQWIADRNLFIRTYSGESEFLTDRHIFRLEVDEITNPRFPNIKFDVLVGIFPLQSDCVKK